jgi:hypothetical protein
MLVSTEVALKAALLTLQQMVIPTTQVKRGNQKMEETNHPVKRRKNHHCRDG